MDAVEISALWCHLLDGPPVDPDEDFFFDLGGHSLLGAAIVTELAATTGLPVELRDLYLAPTPRELAAHLDHLARRLAELRAALPAAAPGGAAGSFDLETFAAALTELGAGAADTLLPPGATVTFGDTDLGGSRVATLRQARGDGACDRVAGTGPGVLLRRGESLLRLDVEPAPAGPRLHFAELAGTELPGAALPAAALAGGVPGAHPAG
jgi:hypothetical protein